MAPRVNALSAGRLRELLDYDPATGEFRWRISSGRGRRPGQPAGVVEPSGYRTICVEGHRYQAQRLAWLHVNGEWPSRFVQFRNNDKSDLRFDNLMISPYGTPGHDMTTKEGRAAYAREYRRQNPGCQQGADFQRMYGITWDQYCEMEKAQGNRCAICRKEETARWQRTDKVKKLSVDHCHSSGKVRDLLCSRCNHMLGLSGDDPVVLEIAAGYLRRHAAAHAAS